MMSLLSNSENKVLKKVSNTLCKWRDRLCTKIIIDSFPSFIPKMKL